MKWKVRRAANEPEPAQANAPTPEAHGVEAGPAAGKEAPGNSRELPAPRPPSRLRRALGRLLLLCLQGLISRRVATALLLLTLVAEMLILGVGVSRKLDQAYEKQKELAALQLAIREAETLGQGLEGKLTEGSAGIGAAPAAPDKPILKPSDEPPPLPARNVETILLQDTDTLIDVTDSPGEEAADSPDADSDPNSTPVIAEDSQPGAEDAAELDQLIRQAVTAMTAGDMRRCILHLEEARAIKANHPAVLYYFGLAYDKLLNPNKAREYYTLVFQQRDKAGRYFQRASRRLTYGLEQPSAMRGKLAFGPHQVRHSYDAQEGERVSILLPVMLAPGEEVKPEDIYVTFQAFDLVNGRKIEFARLAKPHMAWENSVPTWQQWEENLIIEYAVPPLTPEELDAYGDLKYYGFTAKLYYKGEPLDCLSTPSALILQEQRLLSRRSNDPGSGLLPDDGLESMEEALPAHDFLNESETTQP